MSVLLQNLLDPFLVFFYLSLLTLFIYLLLKLLFPKRRTLGIYLLIPLLFSIASARMFIHKKNILHPPKIWKLYETQNPPDYRRSLLAGAKIIKPVGPGMYITQINLERRELLETYYEKRSSHKKSSPEPDMPYDRENSSSNKLSKNKSNSFKHIHKPKKKLRRNYNTPSGNDSLQEITGPVSGNYKSVTTNNAIYKKPRRSYSRFIRKRSVYSKRERYNSKAKIRGKSRYNQKSFRKDIYKKKQSVLLVREGIQRYTHIRKAEKYLPLFPILHEPHSMYC